MNKELYVSSTPHETKVALVEDDLLAEVFFERENEYTLAGSIYKGRVTRVLPGMQSAFVDIGLERDAFLYVSDFLEVTGDEEDEEEFGSIPVPRNAIDVSKAYAAQEAQLKAEPAAAEPEIAEEFEAAEEDFAAPEEQSAGEATEGSTTAEGDSAEGTRPWRGRRRRRGGRRGQGDERNDRPEPKIETAKPVEEAPVYRAETRPPARPRADYGPPVGYKPIVLPGESISKYRNLPQQPAPEPKDEDTSQQASFAPVEDFSPSVNSKSQVSAVAQENESRADLQPGRATAESDEVEHVTAPPAENDAVMVQQETEQTESARHDGDRGKWGSPSAAPSEPVHAQAETPPPETSQATAAAVLTATPEDRTLVEERPAPTQGTEFPSGAEDREPDQAETAIQESPAFPSREAPSVAPEGRTLEHEVLEDEEMEFHPVPDDLSALSEVEGDEELVLEEETLDADNGDSDRWIPKIEDCLLYTSPSPRD